MIIICAGNCGVFYAMPALHFYGTQDAMGLAGDSIFLF
jgi:hypothetical protein